MAYVTWNMARCQVPHPENNISGTGMQKHFHPHLAKTFFRYRTTFPFHISRSNRPGNLVSMGMASCNANVPETERASNFHRTVWGDFFINHSPEPLQAWLSIFTAMMQRESMLVYIYFFHFCLSVAHDLEMLGLKHGTICQIFVLTCFKRHVYLNMTCSCLCFRNSQQDILTTKHCNICSVTISIAKNNTSTYYHGLFSKHVTKCAYISFLSWS